MLKRIEVENFKSLKYLEYSCSKLNLLMGVNGAGKSSFVQFLLFLRSLSEDKLGAANTLRERSEACPMTFEEMLYRYAMNRRIKFSVDFCSRAPIGYMNVGGGDGKPLITVARSLDPSNQEDYCLLYDYKNCTYNIAKYITGGHFYKSMEIVDVQYVREIHASRESKMRRDFEKEHGDRIDPEVTPDLYERHYDICKAESRSWSAIASNICAKEHEKSDEYSRIWKHMRFVDALRGRPRHVHKRIKTLLGDDDMLSPNGEDAVEYLYYAGEGRRLQIDNPMISPNCRDRLRLIDQVNAWLQVVSPGAQIQIDKHDGVATEHFIQYVTFGGASQEHKFKPQHVGFGISYVLPVLVALLTAVPEDIVIIENPEAHLHPRGQAEMGNLIARAAAYGIQVFVETHSDHVINGVRVAVKNGIVKPDDVNIAFFERKRHEVVADDGTKSKEYYSDVRNIKIDAKGSLSEYPEDFMDEWSNQLLRLMKPRTK